MLEITDREIAITVRAALLAIVDIIERKWKLGKHAPGRVEHPVSIPADTYDLANSKRNE